MWGFLSVLVVVVSILVVVGVIALVIDRDADNKDSG